MHNCALHMANGQHSHVIEPKLLLKGLHISNVNEGAWSRHILSAIRYFLFFALLDQRKKNFTFEKSHLSDDYNFKTTFFFYFLEKQLSEEILSVFNANQSNFGADSHLGEKFKWFFIKEIVNLKT